ncbi:hypothetical protein niasHS_006597 [Heterodera schachtii]|uniref:Uncharacterized protein n=1 Tax=Heterodera schachtii TaxID=97005 RepID=A0ABD2JHT9_HETSC
MSNTRPNDTQPKTENMLSSNESALQTDGTSTPANTVRKGEEDFVQTSGTSATANTVRKGEEDFVQTSGTSATANTVREGEEDFVQTSGTSTPANTAREGDEDFVQTIGTSAPANTAREEFVNDGTAVTQDFLHSTLSDIVRGQPRTSLFIAAMLTMVLCNFPSLFWTLLGISRRQFLNNATRIINLALEALRE